MRRVLLLLAFLTITTTTLAQRPPDMPVSPEERAAIIEATAERIERYFVDAGQARTIAAALRAATFTQTMALELVPAVNRVLKAAGGDQHLRFGYDARPGTDEEDTPEALALDAAQNGFGIGGVQQLEGNVGLLTWKKFYDPAAAGEAVAAAMKLLEGTDALIIDLRNSDGGSPQMVLFLLTYFTPEGETLLVTTVENRFKARTEQGWTLPYVPGRRYTGKAVYLLTSKRTFSAGEGFTEHMRRVVHATVIGETTRGGARMSRWMHVHPNFAVSVSVARHVGATQDWEGVGITPDLAVAETDALQAAHALALQKLGR
jgi:hypothetical protein